MENGIEMIDKPNLGETGAVEDGVSQSKASDMDVRGVHELTNFETDEVFEEAVEVQPEDIHTQEQQLEKPDWGDATINGNLSQTGDTDPLEANGSSNEDHGAKIFEEAIDLQSVDRVLENEQPVDVDMNAEVLEAVGPINEVGVATEIFHVEETVKEVVAAGSDGLVSDGEIDNGVEDVKEVDAVVTYGETKHLMVDGEENIANGRGDMVVEKSANGDTDVINLEEALDEDDSNGFDLCQGNEANGQIMHKDDKTGELLVVAADLEAEHQLHVIGDLKDSSNNPDTSVNTESEIAEIVSAPAREDTATETSERLKGDAVESKVEVCKDIQTQSTDEQIEGQYNHAELKEREKQGTQNMEEKNILERESNPEIEPAVDVGLSPENSTDVAPLPPPSHPAGLIEDRHNHAEVKEPEKHVTQCTKEENRSERVTKPEIQPEADVRSSSGNSTGLAPVHPPPRPAGLGAAAPLFGPTPRQVQPSRANGAGPQRQADLVEDPMNVEAEENDETREKLQMIRVKFLRLAHRLGQTPHNVVVAQVLYRLGLAEQLRGRNTGRAGAFSFERASAMAVQLEAAGQDPLDFSCTIMVLGKTGVGKSATINSIFDEVKFKTDAFQLGTKKVQEVVGKVQGIKVRVIDTPGLLPSWSDQRHNEKILHSVKRFIKKTPPDIVLYLDRLDMQNRDFGDMPLLRTITDIFGASIWFNAIVVLTHAASAPPDGPNGTASSYEMFVSQRSHVVQQVIRQAAGDMRLMNPVSLVENHSACRTNRAGQRVLPNGQVWKPHLLLLSFASKILAEANTLLKLQDSPSGKPFATRPRVPPLPFLLSSLLQSRPQLKLPEEQFGDEDTLDEDLDEASDSEDEPDYDELPPFKRLTKAQLSKLSKAQKKAYYDELEYREKLFMKKQLREEKKRRKLLKKMAASAKDLPNDYIENAEEESGAAASVPVLMPDLALPFSFDSDNPIHRYRCLDSSNQWLVRPVLESNGWDHDVGYEGINVERLFVIKENIPFSLSGQATKDKKESNLQMELASSVKHGEGKATSLGFDMQTVGKDMAYTLRSETGFSNFRHNKTAAGLSVTLLGDALTAGAKLENKLIVNKRFRLVMTGGAMAGRGDVAYGGSLEATLRDKDYPLGRTLSTLGLSIMDWHGDLAIGGNLQSQFPLGRSTNMIARANLNNRGAGQVSVRLNSSEQIQIALIALVPLFRKLLGYSQQNQFGQ